MPPLIYSAKHALSEHVTGWMVAGRRAFSGVVGLRMTHDVHM